MAGRKSTAKSGEVVKWDLSLPLESECGIGIDRVSYELREGKDVDACRRTYGNWWCASESQTAEGLKEFSCFT